MLHLDLFFKIKNSFKSSHEAAVIIEDIRVKLNIQQKFSQLNDLLAINGDVYKTWSLLKIDSNLVRIIQVLDNMNVPSKLECLSAYAQSIDLVKWLQINAKNIDEFRFFIELVSISSDNDNVGNHGINRSILATTLFQAGSAYASLIYQFKVDDGFFKFIELAEKVCMSLDSDKKIASKLLGVKDMVPLLDEIKRSRVII